MYTVTDYKTKKALKEDVKAGKQVKVYQPNNMGFSIPTDGVVDLEGPHYPKPHTWYAAATLKNGIVVSVK